MKLFSINKIILSGLAVASLVGAGACKKFLDQQPITSVGTDVVFSDADIGVFNTLEELVKRVVQLGVG